MSLASEPAARQGFRAADLAFVGSGAAFLVVCSLVAIPIGPAGAPITLQTFAVLLLGAVLGSRRGALAVLLYLAVGFAGLPVFAEGTGGPATFAKVTLGYLVAFPVGAWVTGVVVERLGRGRRAGQGRPALRLAGGGPQALWGRDQCMYWLSHPPTLRGGQISDT